MLDQQEGPDTTLLTPTDVLGAHAQYRRDQGPFFASAGALSHPAAGSPRDKAAPPPPLAPATIAAGNVVDVNDGTVSDTNTLITDADVPLRRSPAEKRKKRPASSGPCRAFTAGFCSRSDADCSSLHDGQGPEQARAAWLAETTIPDVAGWEQIKACLARSADASIRGSAFDVGGGVGTLRGPAADLPPALLVAGTRYSSWTFVFVLDLCFSVAPCSWMMNVLEAMGQTWACISRGRVGIYFGLKVSFRRDVWFMYRALLVCSSSPCRFVWSCFAALSSTSMYHSCSLHERFTNSRLYCHVR